MGKLAHLQRDDDIEEMVRALVNPNHELPVLSNEFLDECLNADTSVAEDAKGGLVKRSDRGATCPLKNRIIKDNGGRQKFQKRTRNPRRLPLIYRFIRGLLHHPDYCPAVVCWLDYEKKIFCFRVTEKVAKLWGAVRGNPSMTYAKFTRAMRYHYESKKKNTDARVLFRSYPEDTVYQLGPDASGF